MSNLNLNGTCFTIYAYMILMQCMNIYWHMGSSMLLYSMLLAYDHPQQIKQRYLYLHVIVWVCNISELMEMNECKCINISSVKKGPIIKFVPIRIT